MKIYAISDLHIATTSDKPMEIFGGNWVNYLEKIKTDWQNKVEEEDIVLIGGDISWAMTLENALIDIEYFSSFKGKKIMIRGNHDYWWHGINKIREKLPKNVYAIQNDSIKFDNVVICGSRGWTVPGSPDYTSQDEKLYKREVERLRMSLKNAQKMRGEQDKLILLIHYPPFNVRREDNLFTALFEEFNVDVVVYGHLHGKDVRADKFIYKNRIKYYLTSCDINENKLTEIIL